MAKPSSKSSIFSSAGELNGSTTKAKSSALDEAESAARAVKDPYSGRLSFGCASTTLLYHLPPILAEYARRFPNVELKIAGGAIQEGFTTEARSRTSSRFSVSPR